MFYVILYVIYIAFILYIKLGYLILTIFKILIVKKIFKKYLICMSNKYIKTNNLSTIL